MQCFPCSDPAGACRRLQENIYIKSLQELNIYISKLLSHYNIYNAPKTTVQKKDE